MPHPGTSVMDLPCPARALLECQRMGEEVRSRVVGRRWVPACRSADLSRRVPMSSRARLPKRPDAKSVPDPKKGLVSVRVSRDPVEILPQTILLSPRGVSGISHPGRNESFAKQSSVRRMETTAFLQVHGSHPVSNEFGRGTGSGAHVAAIPHAKGVRGCAPRSISVLRSSIDGSSAERLVLGLAQCGPTFISNRTPKATPAVRGR